MKLAYLKGGAAALGVCCLAALAAGCATQPAPSGRADGGAAGVPAGGAAASGGPVGAVLQPFRRVAEADEVASQLEYFGRMAALPLDDLRREYSAVAESFARSGTEADRLRLALLLSAPGAPFRDDARLVSLIEAAPPHQGAGASPRRDLLGLLLRLAGERQRLAAAAREEQKRIETQGRDEVRRLEGLLRDEQRRADELRQKLDALLAIEREMRNRLPRTGPQK